jgi:hypothetical protein
VLLPSERLQPPTPKPLQTTPARILDGRALPLFQFAPFEPVTDQLQDYGVIFKNAIAITPSNPNFLDYPTQLSIMPFGNRRQLQLTLQRPRKAVALCLQGYREFRVDVLDGNGKAVAVAIQPSIWSGETSTEPIQQRSARTFCKAPTEHIRLDTAAARELIIFSPGAFLLKAVYLSTEQY